MPLWMRVEEPSQLLIAGSAGTPLPLWLGPTARARRHRQSGDAPLRSPCRIQKHRHTLAPRDNIEGATPARAAGRIARVNTQPPATPKGFDDLVREHQAGLRAYNGVVFRTRREAYESVKRGLQGIATIDRRMENPQVTVIAPDVALLVANGSVAATLADGRAMNSRFAVSLVFVLRDGRWKVLHGHYSMQPDRR